jgi:hypothetical protein
MQYCLLMDYQESPDIALTEEDMTPARRVCPLTR